MSKILSLDTATDICSVSISENGKIISYRDSGDDRSHSVKLAVYITEVLEESDLKVEDLEAIAVSKGPGSYTGLRIGVSTAKGLCYGSNLPLISVSTLEAMCYGVSEKFLSGNNLVDYNYVPMLDARRMEVYTAVFNSGIKNTEEIKALILEGNSFDYLLEDKPAVFFGSGASKFKDTVHHPNALFYSSYKHSSRHMIEIAETKLKQENFEDVAYFEPFYLKDFVTTTPKKNILLG